MAPPYDVGISVIGVYMFDGMDKTYTSHVGVGLVLLLPPGKRNILRTGKQGFPLRRSCRAKGETDEV